MNYTKRLFTSVLILVTIIYGTYFSISNLETVRAVLPFLGEFHVAGFVAYLSSFAAGFAVATVLFSIELFKKSMQLRKSQRELNRVARQPTRVSRFLDDENPTTLTEPRISTSDSKLY